MKYYTGWNWLSQNKNYKLYYKNIIIVINGPRFFGQLNNTGEIDKQQVQAGKIK
jgi:outer membrane receptor protein involved in Fe transport